eukprot:5616002-Amphidinium_carterae.1
MCCSGTSHWCQQEHKTWASPIRQDTMRNLLVILDQTAWGTEEDLCPASKIQYNTPSAASTWPEFA